MHRPSIARGHPNESSVSSSFDGSGLESRQELNDSGNLKEQGVFENRKTLARWTVWDVLSSANKGWQALAAGRGQTRLNPECRTLT